MVETLLSKMYTEGALLSKSRNIVLIQYQLLLSASDPLPVPLFPDGLTVMWKVEGGGDTARTALYHGY